MGFWVILILGIAIGLVIGSLVVIVAFTHLLGKAISDVRKEGTDE